LFCEKPLNAILPTGSTNGRTDKPLSLSARVTALLPWVSV
jgi:hypothetical protein